jgi:hypothetical protein
VDPFQTHHFSENLVAPGIEPRPLNLYPGTLITIKLTEILNSNKLLADNPLAVTSSGKC